MKIIKFFTILITPLIVGIACCFIILRVCNINVSSVTNLLLSKIPLINQFVETTANTGLYAISQLDKKELVSSAYNVDFLVSFYQSGKKTIILYPYEIEAGINMEYAEQTQQDSITVITLPNAKIIKSNIDDKKKSNVIREQVDIDYNTHIIPLKIALERRAIDLAVSAGILSDANKNAEKYLSGLFPEQYFRFQKEKAPYDTLKVLPSPHLPITFIYQNKNLSGKELKSNNDDVYFINDLNSENIEFKYGASFTQSFKEVDDSYLYNQYSYLRITDPLNPKKNRSYISTDYDLATIFLDGHYYYLNASGNNKEKLIQEVAPDMIYLTMSASGDNRDFDSNYMKWLNKHRTCFENIQNKRYNDAKHDLKNMEKIRNNRPASGSEMLMRSFINIKTERKFIPTELDENIDKWLEAVDAFDNKKYESADFQEDFLALYNNWFEQDNNESEFLLFFYNTNIEKSIKEEYKNKIIQKADKYDCTIADALKGTDWCDYVTKIITTKDSTYKALITQSEDDSNMKIIIHAQNADDRKEFGDYNKIVKKLHEKGLYKDGLEQVVIGFVEKGRAFDDHNLLVLRKDDCSIFTNVTGWLGSNVYTVSYNKVTASIENESIRFSIGGYYYEPYKKESHYETALVQLLMDMKSNRNGYDFEKKWKQLSEEVTDEVINIIYELCK